MNNINFKYSLLLFFTKFCYNLIGGFNENEVTLKTYYKEKGHFRLQPENDTMEPFIFNHITILGKEIDLYRKL